MTKTELESKHLAELHALAAEAGIDRYRMLPRAELIAKLAGEEGKASNGAAAAKPQGGERPKRQRRRRSGAKKPAAEESKEEELQAPEPAAVSPAPPAPAASG